MSGKKTMPAKAKREVVRKTVTNAPLTTQYRAIGPAAIAAALLCMRKANKVVKSA
jgi:hypothetical protein